MSDEIDYFKLSPDQVADAVLMYLEKHLPTTPGKRKYGIQFDIDDDSKFTGAYVTATD